MTSFTERWLPVVGYEGLYEVSNWGRVKSLARWIKHWRGGERLVKERIRKPTPSAAGYVQLYLCRDGRKTSKYVHALVLTAFVGACPEGMECCHGQGGPSDNRLSNLRWDTPKNNGQDKVLHGTVSRGERQGHATLTEAQVKEIRARCAGGESQRYVAADFGINRTTVSAIHRRKSWAHVA